LDQDVNNKYIEKISDDPSRTLMGARQENWFYRSLSESNDRNATWRVIGSQIVFSHIKGDAAGGGDTWDVSLSNVYFAKNSCLTNHAVGVYRQPQQNSESPVQK
jgi:phosphodiesterase/alkaline phosphatase D-like protein